MRGGSPDAAPLMSDHAVETDVVLEAQASGARSISRNGGSWLGPRNAGSVDHRLVARRRPGPAAPNAIWRWPTWPRPLSNCLLSISRSGCSRIRVVVGARPWRACRPSSRARQCADRPTPAWPRRPGHSARGRRGLCPRARPTTAVDDQDKAHLVHRPRPGPLDPGPWPPALHARPADRWPSPVQRETEPRGSEGTAATRPRSAPVWAATTAGSDLAASSPWVPLHRRAAQHPRHDLEDREQGGGPGGRRPPRPGHRGGDGAGGRPARRHDHRADRARPNPGGGGRG